MVISSISIPDSFWETTEIQNEDLEFIFNHLLDIETPQTTLELVTALVSQKINNHIQQLQKKRQSGGDVYLPKDTHKTGDNLVFPVLEWQKGKINSTRPGHNPELPPFQVMDVQMESGGVRSFAMTLEEHALNEPITIDNSDPSLSPDAVLHTHGKHLISKLNKILEDNNDLVNIAGHWFPRSLLVDINIGHLNLAEAILEEAGGGPMLTQDLLDQIGMSTDANNKLLEFSVNLALQEDTRFDEVGPAGETLWYLKRLEPDEVQNTPKYLRYQAIDVDTAGYEDQLAELTSLVFDEHEPAPDVEDAVDEITISLIFPHWRAGTLPLTNEMAKLFPTAYEAPRVRFAFCDAETGEKFPGWVVRAPKYIYGLRKWYETQGLIPGSLIHIQKSTEPGEILLHVEKKRQNKEWIRTVLVGADGGIVFATLKQIVTAAFDERMVTAIPDLTSVDPLWDAGPKQKLDAIINNSFLELAKLNPQGHVHAQELYASVNLVRRCTPSVLLNTLYQNNKKFSYLGNLYFRLRDADEEA